MAKKEDTANQGASEKLKALQAAMAKIEKDFGKGSIMKLDDEEVEDIEVIPTGSIALNDALGVGGYPKGRIIEIYGPEGSGKTTLAIHAIAEAQRRGGIPAFIDAEHARDRLRGSADAESGNRRRHGRQQSRLAGPIDESGATQTHFYDQQDQHDVHLYQPVARKDRHHLWQSGDDDGR